MDEVKLYYCRLQHKHNPPDYKDCKWKSIQGIVEKREKQIWDAAVSSVCVWMLANWANHGYLDDDDNWTTWIKKIKCSIKYRKDLIK